MSHRLPAITALAALLAAIGQAQASGVPTLSEVVVTARTGFVPGIADAASEGTVGEAQIATRPLLRAAELVETVPGMIVTQHSGDGKANQYFLRGFNLDHGSDFATSVVGVPVNVASHGHGQGYMDLNFVMPELVAAVRYRKGVYSAEDGDFSNTGSARIDYQRQLAHPFVDLSAGGNGFRRILAAGSTELAGRHLLGAIETAVNDGPWDQPEHLHKVNGLLRWSDGTRYNGYSVTAQAYRSRWTATEHVPQRAIDSGEIGRFGALSAGDGGITHRYALSAEWASGGAGASVYLVDYGLNLFSAPSGFIDGPQGDQHEQADQRTTWGGAVHHAWALAQGEFDLGLQLRHDRIGNVGLYRTIARQRIETVRQDSIGETSAGLYASWRHEWQPWLRTTIGLRHDHIGATARATGGAFNGANGGDASASQTSPKFSLVATPAAHTELFANWGFGFHSNDVRGATSSIDPADGTPADRLDLFARAKGGELGLRVEPVPGWVSSVSLWRMSLASELVFVGDEGVTEARGASRRHGVEWSNTLTPREGIIVDADLAWSRARFEQPVNGGDRVPNAIPLTASVGVSLDHGGAWFGGLRTRYIGAYALEETGVEKSGVVLTTNLKLGYRIGRQWQLGLDLLNLFDSRANDIEYWGGACTAREQASGACGGGIDGRLVHPLEPRTLRASLRAAF